MKMRRVVVAMAAIVPISWVVSSGGPAYGGNSGGNAKNFAVQITESAAGAAPGVLSPNVAGESAMKFNITIVNENPLQTLGSMDLSLPSAYGFVLPAESVQPVAATGYQVTPNPIFDVTSSGVIEVRGMSLPSGGSAQVSFSVTAYAPCFDETAVNVWTIIGKQANDFSGTPGNSTGLDVANSSYGAVVSDACGLQFHKFRDLPPLQGQVGTALSDTDFTAPGAAPSGSPAGTAPAQPIEVQIVDDQGNPINSSDASASTTVTVGPLTAVNGSALPSESTSASGGLASFAPPLSGLVPTQPFTDNLLATASAGPGPTQLSPGTSDSVEVWGSGQICVGSSQKCTPNNPVTNNNVSANASGTTGTSGSIALLGLSQQIVTGFVCGDRFFHAGTPKVPVYTTVESVNLFGTVTETVTIGRADVQGPASQYEVCYGDPGQTFDVLGGGTSPGGPALLATCKATAGTANPLPCVLSISKNNQGGITEIIDFPPNDPHTSY